MTAFIADIVAQKSSTVDCLSNGSSEEVV